MVPNVDTHNMHGYLIFVMTRVQGSLWNHEIGVNDLTLASDDKSNIRVFELKMGLYTY